jgi:hypothetical protein
MLQPTYVSGKHAGHHPHLLIIALPSYFKNHLTLVVNEGSYMTVDDFIAVNDCTDCEHLLQGAYSHYTLQNI